MNYQLFSGCNTPLRLDGYRKATLAVVKELGVDVECGVGFNCCGYPMRNSQNDVFLLSSARNLAISEKARKNILVLCKCCFGSLKKAQDQLNQDLALREKINEILRREGLVYRGLTRVTHLLSLLRYDIGMEAIKKRVTSPLAGVKVGVQYGCHLLRPSNITEFEENGIPVFFDELVRATGAESVDYKRKFDCCGAPLNGINSSLSEEMTEKKLMNIKDGGASLVATGCPYCHLQFAKVAGNNPGYPMPVVYPQLLGLSMGIEPERLGMESQDLRAPWYNDVAA